MIFAMPSPRRLWRLVLADAMSVVRDPMLAYVTALSVLPAILFFLFREALDAWALESWSIAEFSRYLVPVVLMIPATLLGWVSGFLLLEDRDERTLLAIEVTPVGKSGFLLYRGLATALLTAGVTWLSVSLLLPEGGSAPWLWFLVLVPASAVLAALVLPAVARNKVEGLALTKLTNIAAVVPLLALLPSEWRLIAGVVPSYWLGELLDLSRSGTMPSLLAGGVGLAAHALWGVVLYRMFLRRVE